VLVSGRTNLRANLGQTSGRTSRKLPGGPRANFRADLGQTLLSARKPLLSAPAVPARLVGSLDLSNPSDLWADGFAAGLAGSRVDGHRSTDR